MCYSTVYLKQILTHNNYVLRIFNLLGNKVT